VWPVLADVVPVVTAPRPVDAPAAAKPASELVLILVLGLLAAFGPLAIDMYLPAFSAIGRDLATTPSAVGWTLAVYFVGLAAGQLVVGPLADRVGRSGPLRVGIAVFVAASVLAALATRIELLVVARGIQSLGGAACTVTSRAVVRDLYRGRDAARVNSRLVLVMGVAPIVAPLIGGALLGAAGWRAIFVLLAVLGSAAYAATRRFLPETRPPAARGVASGPAGAPSVGVIRALTSDRGFVTYAVIAGASSAALFGYITGSPLVFIEIHHVAPGHFGWLFGANAAGYIGFSQLNARLVRDHAPQVLLRLGLCGLTTASLALVVIALTSSALWPIAASCFVLLASLGFVMPNAISLALEDHGKRAGSAAAVLGALQFGLGAAASGVVSARYDGTALPMSTTVLGFALLAGGVLVARSRSLANPGRAPAGSTDLR